MQNNDHIRMMRQRIFDIAQRNNRTQRKIQEERNIKVFGAKPTYRVVDMLRDVREMNDQQYDYFMNCFTSHQRVRIEGIFEQVYQAAKDVVKYRSHSMSLFESSGFVTDNFLIESAIEVKKKEARELERKIERAVLTGSTEDVDKLQTELKDVNKQIEDLEKGESEKGKSEKGEEAPAEAEAEVEKPKEEPKEEPKSEKPKEESKSKPKPEPEAEPEAKVEKPKESQFKRDFMKHYDLLNQPVGDAAEYYARRARELTLGAAKGLAWDLPKGIVKGLFTGKTKKDSEGSGSEKGAEKAKAEEPKSKPEPEAKEPEPEAKESKSKPKPEAEKEEIDPDVKDALNAIEKGKGKNGSGSKKEDEEAKGKREPGFIRKGISAAGAGTIAAAKAVGRSFRGS